MVPVTMLVLLFSSVFYLLNLPIPARGKLNGVPCEPDGALHRKLSQLYVCEAGKFKLKGCLNEFGKDVYVNGTFFGQDFEWACNKVTDNWFQMTPLACWYKGKTLELEEIYVEKPFWYTCKRTRGHHIGAQLVATGCVNGHNDEKLSPGQSFQSGPYIFTCNKYSNSSVRIEPVACVYDNRQVLLGGELEHPNYAFKCQRSRNNIGIEFAASACMFNKTKFLPGQQYVKNGFVLQCHKSENRISHIVVGCVDAGGRWYTRGEQWILGSGALRYVTECVIDENKRRALKVAVQCLYAAPSGPTVIHPGCMKRFNDTLVQCHRRSGSESIEFRVTAHARGQERVALRDGVRYC